jgi:5-methylthioribose kinase
LGLGSDFLGLYKSEISLDNQDIKQLLVYLSELHALKVEAFPENIEMRKLNHEHIFNFPYNEANGFDLDMIQPGLKNLAKTYQSDIILKDRILMLGEQYLSKGSSLIHGDFYPGSWLKVDSGIKVIDPEFSFVGHPEFDLGVMIAHLEMAGLTINFSDFLENYTHRQNVDMKLLTAYCGVEVLRRILGLAQLPLAMTINQKELLLNKAKSYILT